MDTKHILVVDDEPKLAFFLGKALEKSNQNCRVSVANTGEVALQKVRQEEVNLLITDLRMPGITGLELIRRVRAESPETRLILMTAFGSSEVEDEVLNLQVSRYLTKPFHLKDLLNATTQILNDMEVTQGGILAVSEQQFETMAKILQDLLQETGLQAGLLADPLGQVLLSEGTPPDVDITALVALFAGGFATVFEVARHLRDSTPISVRYYEGKRHEIYTLNVGTALLMLLIGVRGNRSRLGTVWHYSQRAAKDLEKMVSQGQAQGFQTLQQGAEALEDGFGESFMAELDNVLGSDTFTTPTPQVEQPAPEPPQAIQDAQPPPEHDDQEPSEVLSFEEAMARGLLGSDFKSE